MQGDGNFVAYQSGTTPLWYSKLAGSYSGTGP